MGAKRPLRLVFINIGIRKFEEFVGKKLNSFVFQGFKGFKGIVIINSRVP